MKRAGVSFLSLSEAQYQRFSIIRNLTFHKNILEGFVFWLPISYRIDGAAKTKTISLCYFQHSSNPSSIEGFLEKIGNLGNLNV